MAKRCSDAAWWVSGELPVEVALEVGRSEEDASPDADTEGAGQLALVVASEPWCKRVGVQAPC